MKKAVFVFFCIALLVQALPASAAVPGNLYSETVCLMDYETGQILFEKDMHRRVYPASATKIMTAVLAVENGFPEERMAVSKEAVAISEPQSSNIGLTEGDELTLDEGLFAMMLPSANDAANVVGEHIGGNLEDFAAMMTAKARMLGAENTNFTNTHGLHEENHYTTAYDLALITRYAAGDDRFMRYFGRDTYTMGPTNQIPYERPLSNYQYMLIETSGFYDPTVIGGKVGYTGPAGHTMSTVAERGGRKLICVVMKSPNRNDKFIDTKKLLEYGFDSFRQVTAPKDFFTGFTVPIFEDSGQAGAARFDILPDFTVLLENGLEASAITAELSVPGRFYPGDRLVCEITYRLPDAPPGIPSVLGTQIIAGSGEPLPPDTAAYAPVSLPVEPIRPKPAVNWALAAEITVGTGAAVFALAVALRHYTLLRRRKSRLRRMRLQQQQEQKRLEARKQLTVADKIRIRQHMTRP